MGLFVTDNKFNIIDDPDVGLPGKTPKKSKILSYIFWIMVIGLVLFVFLDIFNLHAEASTYIFQQQDTSTSTFPGIYHSPVGQSDIFYPLTNGTTTLSSITLHLEYTNTSNIGQIHKICFYQQIYSESSWYLDINNPIGCFSRVIQVGDIDTPKDFNFYSSVDVSFPNLENTFYSWLNIGVATSTNPYDILAGVNNLYAVWYGNSNELAYGGDTIASSVSITPSLPSGLLMKNCPENYPSYTGVCDNFFIMPGGWTPTAGMATSTYNISELYAKCDSLEGFISSSLCNLGVYLFVPGPERLNQFSDLWNNIKYKPPFGYYTAISTALGNIAVGTTTLQFAGISDISIFGTMRTIAEVILWFLFAFWIFHRIRLFDF